MLPRLLRRTGLMLVVLVGCADDPPPPPPPAPAPPPKVEVEDTGRVPSGNARPRITKLSYSPGNPTTTDHIRLEVDGEDPDGGVVRFKYQWFINGKRMLHLNRDNLPASYIERGDEIYCEVRALDDDDEEALRKTATIEVGNALPTFTTDPRRVRNLDGLVLQADDPDNDTLTFTMEGAPKGMVINPKSGKITYKGSTEEPGGHYTIVATVNDGHGGTRNWSFEIDVSAGSDARAKSKASADAGTAETDPGTEDPKPAKRERRRTAW